VPNGQVWFSHFKRLGELLIDAARLCQRQCTIRCKVQRLLQQAKARECLSVCRGLMAQQSLAELGLAGMYKPEGVEATSDTTRSAEGFVAGMRTKTGVR
jgi:hypothetical protein